MKKLRGLLFSVLITVLAIYGILWNNQFALNLFTTATWFFFFIGCLIIFSVTVLHDNQKVQEFVELMSDRLKNRTTIETVIDKSSDMILLVVLFGSANWIKGIIWVFNHYIVTRYLKQAVETYNKQFEADAKPLEASGCLPANDVFK